MLTSIPTPLCAWLTLLAQAVPNRSALTFLELLVGAMITDRGFVTEALLAITPRRKWPTYFKWLEGGKWSWIAVAQRLCKILVTHFAPPVWFWSSTIRWCRGPRRRRRMSASTSTIAESRTGRDTFGVRVG
jgi:hypothetical protein